MVLAVDSPIRLRNGAVRGAASRVGAPSTARPKWLRRIGDGTLALEGRASDAVAEGLSDCAQ